LWARSITGHRNIVKNKSSDWFVINISNGVPPFRYRWYIKKISQIMVLALPSNGWYPINGNDENYLRLKGSPTDKISFQLKCEVTDATNTTITSNIILVNYISSDIRPNRILYSKRDNLDLELYPERGNPETTISNYPNPFNPNTKIKYSLSAETSKVKITVYNILGEEIKILVDEEKTQGTYHTNFDGSNLSSGIYFCKITVGKYIKIIKLVLNK